MRKLSREMSYKPRGTNVYDFLTEFGLDIASRPSSGNIISTAAAAAKEPYQRFTQRKGEAEAAGYVSESDMFKTLIGAQAKVLGSEGGGKTYADLEKIERIEKIMQEQFDIKRQVDSGKIKADDIIPEYGYSIKERLVILNKQLNNLIKKDPAVIASLKIEQLTEGLYATIVEGLVREIDPVTQKPKYKGDQDPDLIKEAQKLWLENFGSAPPVTLNATGGRVGFVGGGASGVVSTGGYDTTGRPGYDIEGGFQPSNIPGMPEELSDISYEELRARLPQEVSNEVVRLLANSPEALEDFAVIQTEQDIANFNKKYGVNLVLPAEA
jgi:hypothetical protein